MLIAQVKVFLKHFLKNTTQDTIRQIGRHRNGNLLSIGSSQVKLLT